MSAGVTITGAHQSTLELPSKFADETKFAQLLSSRLSQHENLMIALQETSTQFDNGLSEAIRYMSEEVAAGTSLGGALQKFPEQFSAELVRAVQAGEIHNRLAEMLLAYSAFGITSADDPRVELFVADLKAAES